MSKSETVEGYVVDIACIGKYPPRGLLERARRHTRDGALMGRCVESGYGLVNESGLTLLDDHATPKIVAAVKGSSKEDGIRLRAIREFQNGEMHTTRIDELA